MSVCRVSAHPVQRPPDALERSDGDSGEVTPRAGHRVLVVDDDPGLRLICRFNLEAAGMHVSEASDGESALELATADPPDAILLDVMMPGLDGWAVAAELHERAATRDIPIVFVTARGSDADRERGLELAAAGYVTKPFDPSTLTALIERLLGRREGA